MALGVCVERGVEALGELCDGVHVGAGRGDAEGEDEGAGVARHRSDITEVGDHTAVRCVGQIHPVEAEVDAVDGGVATITINRPEKLNAVTAQSLQEIEAAQVVQRVGNVFPIAGLGGAR